MYITFGSAVYTKKLNILSDSYIEKKSGQCIPMSQSLWRTRGLDCNLYL